MLMKNKKGISPLIATVLIIGFTIALAVLIISWIMGIFDDKQCDIDCNIAANDMCLDFVGDLDAVVANDSSNQNWTLSLINKGSSDLGKVTVIWYYEDGSSGNITELENLSAFSSIRTQITNTNDIHDIKIIPIMHSDVCNGCNIECSEKEIEL